MTPRCENVLNRRGPCNQPLRIDTDGSGVVRFRCVRCEARARGCCWNCGKLRTNHPTRGVFCDPCGYAAYRMAQRRTESSPERRQARKAYDKRRWRHDPEARERRKATRAAWIKAHPEKVREYKRREAQRHKQHARSTTAEHRHAA